MPKRSLPRRGFASEYVGSAHMNEQDFNPSYPFAFVLKNELLSLLPVWARNFPDTLFVGLISTPVKPFMTGMYSESEYPAELVQSTTVPIDVPERQYDEFIQAVKDGTLDGLLRPSEAQVPLPQGAYILRLIEDLESCDGPDGKIHEDCAQVTANSPEECAQLREWFRVYSTDRHGRKGVTRVLRGICNAQYMIRHSVSLEAPPEQFIPAELYSPFDYRFLNATEHLVSSGRENRGFKYAQHPSVP